MIRTALISVSDKTGIVDFARALSGRNISIISTGGTARALTAEGVPVITVDSLTGFPEMLDGRVKTLHPKLHGGILAKRDSEQHMRQLQENGIGTIDLVVVNLYPFRETVKKEGASLEEIIENIDIGGPAMLRSAAKNYPHVGAVTDPEDYNIVLEEIQKNGELSLETRKYLAAKVFRHTADYDSAIDIFLSERFLGEHILRLKYTGGKELRYGENWHQKAKFYREENLSYPNLADAEKLWGKELSYNNYLDMSGAVMAVKDFSSLNAVSVIKHTNPCGLATGKNIASALQAAWDGDRVSAFGSVIACTGVFDIEAAEFLSGKMVEAVLAPDFTDEALEQLKKKKNIMLLKLNTAGEGGPEKVFRQALGGMLAQDPDDTLWEKWEVVTKKGFEGISEGLAEFAMSACKNTKSNAIVLCEEYEKGFFRVLGMGAGQPNRVDSLRKLAATKALENLEITLDESGEQAQDRTAWLNERMGKAVMASDAFFPFDDTVREAASLGIRYIVQPGGSVKDNEVIAAADELGVSMVFTGTRHFLH